MEVASDRKSAETPKQTPQAKTLAPTIRTELTLHQVFSFPENSDSEPQQSYC